MSGRVCQKETRYDSRHQPSPVSSCGVMLSDSSRLTPMAPALAAPSPNRAAPSASAHRSFRTFPRLAAQQVLGERLDLLGLQATLVGGHHALGEARHRECRGIQDRLLDVLLGSLLGL